MTKTTTLTSTSTTIACNAFLMRKIRRYILPCLNFIHFTFYTIDGMGLFFRLFLFRCCCWCNLKAYSFLHHITSQKMLIKAAGWVVFFLLLLLSSLSLVENLCCVTNCQQPKHLAWNSVRLTTYASSWLIICVFSVHLGSHCLRCIFNFFFFFIFIALFHLSTFYMH